MFVCACMCTMCAIFNVCMCAHEYALCTHRLTTLPQGSIPQHTNDMYMKDGLHLSGKGAAVFSDELTAAVDSGMGT